MNQHTLLRLENTDYLTTRCSNVHVDVVKVCEIGYWHLRELHRENLSCIPILVDLIKVIESQNIYLNVVTVRIQLFKRLCLITCS